jgi:hypothetical protein
MSTWRFDAGSGVCVIGLGTLRCLHPCFSWRLEYVESLKLLHCCPLYFGSLPAVSLRV